MHILIAEDNPDHLELITDILKSSFGRDSKIKAFTTFDDSLHYLISHTVDVFLCDLKLPDSTIQETVERLKNIEDAPPIIVLTSLHNEDLAHQLVKDGIQDFLPKDELTPSQLVRSCHYAIERKKLTQSLLDKNEDYKAFCYSLTHDFKSSLWQIARFAQIFKIETQKKYPNDDTLPFQYLDKVSIKIENIQKLIEDLQDFLSIDAIPESHGLIQLNIPINNALDMLSEKIASKKASIQLESLPQIYGNLSQLQLVFFNLISNAIKYNESDIPTVKIYAQEKEEEVVIFIADNGIGIPTDKADIVFAPFERLHRADQYPGSGLGLSIVKRIVKSHRGKIELITRKSDPQGTTFSIRFPQKRLEYSQFE